MRRVRRVGTTAVGADLPDRRWPVKVFQGDPTDVERFAIGAQITTSLADFWSLDARRHMIRVDLQRTADLRPLAERIEAEARALQLPPKCLMLSLRITGASWAFPYHYDKIDQYVFQLGGTKRWFWKEGGREVHLLSRPGDVLFVPAGLYHRTEGDSESVVCNYGVECEDEDFSFCERGPTGGSLSPRNVCHNHR